MTARSRVFYVSAPDAETRSAEGKSGEDKSSEDKSSEDKCSEIDNSTSEVVVEYHGREVARYQSSTQMVETHIKGMLAIRQDDADAVIKLMQKYIPTKSST